MLTFFASSVIIPYQKGSSWRTETASGRYVIRQHAERPDNVFDNKTFQYLP